MNESQADRFTNDLISTFTSNNYVHLECNRGAIDARDRIVAEKYNGPGLLVCGAVGSGKTHFLHSIGHEWQRQQKTLLCMSAERFANFVLSASKIQLNVFRRSWNGLHGAIIDGLPFVFGKKKIEAELALLLATLAENKNPAMVDGCFDMKHELQCDHRLWQQLAQLKSIEIFAPSQKDQALLLQQFVEIQNAGNLGGVEKLLGGVDNPTIRDIESLVRKIKASSDATS
jgi:chromosomal replication initiation ATPase DnaA